jgi:hypothetical protein
MIFQTEINGKVSAHSQLSHYRLHPIYICRLPKVEVSYPPVISKPKGVLKSAKGINSEKSNFKLIRQLWRKLILAYIQACRRYILHSPATYRVKLVMSSWRNTEAPITTPVATQEENICNSEVIIGPHSTGISRTLYIHLYRDTYNSSPAY